MCPLLHRRLRPSYIAPHQKDPHPNRESLLYLTSMGKTNQKRKASSPSEPVSSSAQPSEGTACRRQGSAPTRTELLPLPFPSHLPRPDTGFLREVDCAESFRVALETAYVGLVVDEAVVPNEADIQQTLTTALSPWFRTDVTQPFGLGTACAPTYVTRCLVGDVGTTYKYLGLRMFAHSPWPATIDHLRSVLTDRVQYVHGPTLAAQRRQQRNLPQQRLSSSGATRFDVCLINRMTFDPNWKTEALDPNYRTAVSWHADSSLEHYSTIAVYQTIVPSPTTAPHHHHTNNSNNEWWIGLRVTPHAEGPACHSLRRSGAPETTLVLPDETTTTATAPMVALALPTNAAYYMLDDFNHHHQHTVLATTSTTNNNNNKRSSKKKTKENHSRTTTNNNNNNDGGGGVSSLPSVRYSLTFRLLRDSHNVSHMLERCQRTVSHFHKKGTKLYRSEQLTLTALESEWLRQFYIQGAQHRASLWSRWSDPLQHLWQYWNQLEQRTYHTVTLLRWAAEGRCLRPSDAAGAASRAERKLRDKRKKAAATLRDVLDRELSSPSNNSNNKNNNSEGSILMYESMAGLLEERAVMRELWGKREKDHVFRDMSAEYRPLPLPCRFGVVGPVVDEKSSSACQSEQGVSPMPGTPEELRTLAMDLRALGRAYVSGESDHLPNLFEPARMVGTTDELSKAVDWIGWTEYDFGLEMQCPWARSLLDGHKTIETRAYNLPPALLGKKIAILETPQGQAGVSDMGDSINFDTGESKIIGWCRFSGVRLYSNSQAFARDEKAHLVQPSSGFGWKEGATKLIYGWVVSERGGVDDGDALRYKSATRRLRSLYQLTRECSEKLSAGKIEPQQGKATNESARGIKKKKTKKRRF